MANDGAGRISTAGGRTAGAKGLTDVTIAGVDAIVDDGGRGRRGLNVSDLLGMLTSLVDDVVTMGSVTSFLLEGMMPTGVVFGASAARMSRNCVVPETPVPGKEVSSAVDGGICCCCCFWCCRAAATARGRSRRDPAPLEGLLMGTRRVCLARDTSKGGREVLGRIKRGCDFCELGSVSLVGVVAGVSEAMIGRH